MLTLDKKTEGDLMCLLQGQFAPLHSFMSEKDWRSVCENMHLVDGSFFPLPITLAVEKDRYEVYEHVVLYGSSLFPIVDMMITEVYTPDIDLECLQAYGTLDDNHPYVQYKMSHKDKVYISGPFVNRNEPPPLDFFEYRLTPEYTREVFKEKGWKTIVGFQTRNPMHRAHFELTQYALRTAGKDAKLFLNPVVGETQEVDIDYATRVKCYIQILQRYEEDGVLMCLLPLTMRMAGPREACLHALIRRNYGCTHFIVGRDHAGPSYKTKTGEAFYQPYAAQSLFKEHAKEIGIIPIVSEMIVFNNTVKQYMPFQKVTEGHQILALSGTEFRRLLRVGEEIPEWFSFPEVVNVLKNAK